MHKSYILHDLDSWVNTSKSPASKSDYYRTILHKQQQILKANDNI